MMKGVMAFCCNERWASSAPSHVLQRAGVRTDKQAVSSDSMPGSSFQYI